jgi:uncharacterized protein
MPSTESRRRVASRIEFPHRKIYILCARTDIMVYTEIKKRNGKNYFYRVRSIREGKKFRKDRIYLGCDLSKEDLIREEGKADKELLKEKIEKGINKIKPKILEVLKKNRVKRAGIFGSYARGEQKSSSDIDILIEPPKGIGFGFFKISIELEDSLGKKVDLVTYNGLNPLLRERILSQEVRII